MSKNITKSRKKNYWVFSLDGNVDMEYCINLKEVLIDPIKADKNNICFDMTNVTDIHKNGIRLIKNVQKMLSSTNRSVVLFGASGKVLESLTNSPNMDIPNYQNVHEFEQSFSTEFNEANEKFYKLAVGKGALRQLNLKCPLCDADGITGYLWDSEKYKYQWEDNEITPQWRLKANKENEVDVELYEIAVCHKCFFATNNISHFIVCFPEGTINSSLAEEQREQLVKKSGSLNMVMGEYKNQDLSTFFTVPRKRDAALLSWQLYEKTTRNISRDKSELNILDLARASILSAKFAQDKETRTSLLSTAHVWLTDLVNNPEGNLNIEIVMGNIYLISVSLAMGKEKDAQGIYENFISQFGEDKFYEFWIERAHSLMEDENKEDAE